MKENNSILIVASEGESFQLDVWNVTNITDKQLIEILVEAPSAEWFVVEFQQKLLEKKREKYDEQFMPDGFEYAPEVAKKYWQKLKKKDDTDKMKILKNELSYNSDGTVNLIKINEVFCSKVLDNPVSTIDVASEVAEAKWYKLLNFREKNNDWEKIQNVFGYPLKLKDILKMLWCDTGFKYWTSELMKWGFSDDHWDRVCLFYLNIESVPYSLHKFTPKASEKELAYVCGLKKMS